MAALSVHTLPNGLTVVLVEDHAAPVVTMWVWYRVGSRNEASGTTGISHWVEHMMFKGTPSRPKGTLTRLVDRLGGRWNAFTWKDYTAYFEMLPAEHLGIAVALEADRMVNTVFEPDEVESERTVIIAEREGSENFPSYLLSEEVEAIAYKEHPYRLPVIGWKQDLRGISREDLVAHYRTFYHPNNAIVVAAGDFPSETALRMIEDAFEALSPGPPVPRVRAQEGRQEGERRVRIQRPGGGAEYLQLAYHVPPAAHPDFPALSVLDGILSGFKGVAPFEGAIGRRSSRLYRALVDGGLATDVGSSISPAVDPSLFQIVATARGGVSVARLEERIFAELQEVIRHPVGTEELAKVKRQVRAQFAYGQDGVFGKAVARGLFAVVDSPEAFETLPARIDRVSADDIVRVATTNLLESNRTVGWYIPEQVQIPTPSRPPYQAGVVGFDGRSAVPLRTHPITPEVVTRVQLDNGMVVLIQETRGRGLVAVHGYVKAGAIYDKDRSGMARMVAGSLQRGTRSKSSQEIALALDSLGAGLAIRADMEAVTVSMRTLREDAGSALEILGEVLLGPVFPTEEVEKVRGEALTSLRIGLQDTRQVAERTFRSLAYPPGHPHAQFPDGELAVIETLQRDELAAFHEAYYRPEATILVVVGDLAAAEALQTIKGIFSQWSQGGRWALPPIPVPVPRETPVRKDVRLPGKTQSDIVLGAPGINRHDPAYYRTMMANLILGQLGMMGRLGDRVRERGGMAYYAFSDLRACLVAGPWWIRAGVNPQNEDRAVATILEEIRRFQEEGPEEGEVADARSFLIGSLAIRLETSPGIAQVLADIEFFDLGLDYLIRFPDIIAHVSTGAIQQAARRFPLAGYSLAIAGPTGTT
jgi:zinc protease